MADSYIQPYTTLNARQRAYQAAYTSVAAARASRYSSAVAAASPYYNTYDAGAPAAQQGTAEIAQFSWTALMVWLAVAGLALYILSIDAEQQFPVLNGLLAQTLGEDWQLLEWYAVPALMWLPSVESVVKAFGRALKWVLLLLWAGFCWVVVLLFSIPGLVVRPFVWASVWAFGWARDKIDERVTTFRHAMQMNERVTYYRQWLGWADDLLSSYSWHFLIGGVALALVYSSVSNNPSQMAWWRGEEEVHVQYPEWILRARPENRLLDDGTSHFREVYSWEEWVALPPRRQGQSCALPDQKRLTTLTTTKTVDHVETVRQTIAATSPPPARRFWGPSAERPPAQTPIAATHSSSMTYCKVCRQSHAPASDH